MIIPVILAAGVGTRMLPLTKRLAKACLPFFNIPLIGYAVYRLQLAGFKEVWVNLFHEAESSRLIIQLACDHSHITPHFITEPFLSGSGGGLRAIYDEVNQPDATFLLMNADTVIEPDIKRLIRTHQRTGAKISMLLSSNPDSTSVGIRAKGTNSQVAKLRQYGAKSNKGLLPCDFTGVQLISGDLIAQIPQNTPCDMIDTLHGPYLEEGGFIQSLVHRAYWVSVESPEILLRASRELLTLRKRFNFLPLGRTFDGGHLFVQEEAQVSPCIIRGGPVVVGGRVKVHSGALFGRNVVLDNVVVAPNASIKNAVIHSMGLIEGEWHNCVAIAGEVVQF